MPAGRLLAAGYGQFHPLATNANPNGRAQNRRIEILLTPTLSAKKGAISTPPAKPVAKAAPAPAPAPAPAKAAKPAPAKPAGKK